jgi:hypothetical protein
MIFKLGRYINSNLESGVHEACWIDLLCSMQSFECFDMLMITCTHYTTCCFDLINAKSYKKEEGIFYKWDGSMF